MYAVLEAIKRFAHRLYGRLVRIYVDNSVALSYFRNLGGRIPQLNSIVRRVFDLLSKAGARAVFLRVRSAANPADQPSRRPSLWTPDGDTVSQAVECASHGGRPISRVLLSDEVEQALRSHKPFPASTLWVPAVGDLIRTAHALARSGGLLLAPRWPAARFAPVLSALAMPLRTAQALTSAVVWDFPRRSHAW